MAKREYFRTGAGSTKLTGDGAYLTEVQGADWESCTVVVAAYDVGGNIVQASTGIAFVEFSPLLGQYHGGVDDGFNPIDLTSIEDKLPVVYGPVISARMTITETDFVTDGIDHIKAFCWRS